MKLINWLKNITSSKKTEQTISYFENGFELNDGANKSQIKWEEIDKIDAYKRDLMVEDQICLEFKIGNKLLYCSEDYKGFIEFEKFLQEKLEGIDKSWIWQVSQPPFLDSSITIYSKEEYYCSICGDKHSDWPALTFSSPNSYNCLSEDEKESIAAIDSDFCTIRHDDQIDRFIRVVLKQKVNDSSQNLDYGLWVSLSEESYSNYTDNFNNENHKVQYFGWLNNMIPGYNDTTSIPTTVITKTGNERPEIYPHRDFKHQFVADYYNGISREEAERRIHDMMRKEG